MKLYRIAIWTISTILIGAAAFPALAQQPRVSNTNFTGEAVNGSLGASLERLSHAHEALWVGYEVPALPDTRLTSCSSGNDPGQSDDGCCGEFRLEDHDYTNNNGKNAAAARSVYVLLRFDHDQVVKIRPVPTGCHLNAGGVDFIWLTGVSQEESIAYLERTAMRDGSEKHAYEGAMVALSYHASPEATRTLHRIASSNASMHTREQAAFWLGVQRGHDGYVALKDLEEKSTDASFRQKLAFDFSQNSDPAAEDELLRMAKSDNDEKVREQAIFWIAQKAGKKAVATITDAIQNDPETDVKKHAVFALSQLPKDEGVPQLIHVADTNKNPTVRKEAIFWLGQSHDPRALQFLEAVLKR